MHRLSALLLASLLLVSCQRDDAVTEPGGARPVEAITQLNAHLINNDLAAFARAALPPELHARLNAAWQSGHTRWPLDELPFSAQYPEVLAALSADHAHADLMAVFDQQLAGAEADLQQSALMLSAFMVQFIQHQGSAYSESERAHYSALVTAAGQWAASAPLADRERAGEALDILMAAARKSRLDGDAAWMDAEMEQTLHRIAPMLAAFKQALALYGLEIDSMLTGADVQLHSRSGDTAQVQMRYRLGESTITAMIPVLQIDGRWYVSDFVHRVSQAAPADSDSSDTF